MHTEIFGTFQGIEFEGTLYTEEMTYDHPGCAEVEIISAWIDDEEDFSLYDHGIEIDEKSLINFLDNKSDELIEEFA